MGFRSLLNLNDPNYTVASFAARAGKSEAYVLGRIKLTELISSIADAFLADAERQLFFCSFGPSAYLAQHLKTLCNVHLFST